MITLEDVTKVYTRGDAQVPALGGVSLAIERGEFLAIVGASGSGKSTLLNIIGCLDRPSSGRHTFLGVDVAELGDRELSRLRNHSIGFVFQAFNLVSDLTVRENVELPLTYDGRARERHGRALAALASVGLESIAEHPAALLSGGEQQRTAIARALVNSPDLILADEPTGSIDHESADVVLGLLHQLHQQSHTIVMVTHQPAVAAHADRIVRLQSGRVTEAAAAPMTAARMRTR
jgi:putative ABC transport system ATP-binding protein